LSAPVGPTGCDATPSEAEAHPWFAGASVGYVVSDLVFDGTSDYRLQRPSVVALVGRRLSSRASVEFAAGALLGGSLVGEGLHYDTKPGWVGTLTGAYRWTDQPGRVPLFVTTLTLGASRSPIRERGGAGERSSVMSDDLRLGAIVGWTFGRVWAPYAALRVFGGPVTFNQDGSERVGSDRHHFALAVGSNFVIAEQLELSVDWAYLGERGISGGFNVAF
jgi:hypothetical protein